MQLLASGFLSHWKLLRNRSMTYLRCILRHAYLLLANLAVVTFIAGVAVAGGVLTGFAHGDSINGKTFPSNPKLLQGEVVSSIDYYGAIGFGLAIVSAVASLRWRRGLALVVFLGSFFTVSQYISWAAYRSVTHAEITRSFGVFDWLLGRLGSSPAFSTIWQRNVAGMSLWGAAITAAPGLLLYISGYSPFVLLAGWAMGPVYLAARALHPYSDWDAVLGGGDQATAFFLFGVWLFSAVLLSLVAHAATGAAPDKLPTLKTHDITALRVATFPGCASVLRGTWPVPMCGDDEPATIVWASPASTLSGPSLWLLHAYCVAMEVLLALSLVSVAQLPTEQQWREFKRDQDTGLGGTLLCFTLVHFALIWQQYKYHRLVRQPLLAGGARSFTGMHTRLLAGGTAPGAGAGTFAAWMPSTSDTVNAAHGRVGSEDSTPDVAPEDVLVYLPGRGNEHMCCRCDCHDGCTDERWEADGFEPQGNVWCSRGGCASGVSSCCIVLAAAEPYQLVPLPAYVDWQEGDKGGIAATAASLRRAGSVGSLCPRRAVPGAVHWSTGGGFGDGVPRDAVLASGASLGCGLCFGNSSAQQDEDVQRTVTVPVPFMAAWALQAFLLASCAAWLLAAVGMLVASAARGEHQFGV